MPSPPPRGCFRAFLFDCDGVLVDAEPLHLRMFQKVLAEEGIALSQREYFEKYLAMDDRGCFRAVLAEHGRHPEPADVAALVARKAEYYKTTLGGAAMYPGVRAFVAACAARARVALASGSLHSELDFILDSTGLRPHFEVVVGADDVQFGKPHPETYLKALAGLNAAPPRSGPAGQGMIQPAECLVIEDSIHGVHSAKNAGMRCLAVTNSYPADRLSQADWVVASLEGLDPDALPAAR